MLFAVLFACSGADVAEAPPAAVTELEAPAPLQVSSDLPDGIAVDAAGSSIGFVGAKVTGSHDGGFKGFDGVLQVEGDAPTGTTFVIDMGTTWADSEKLAGHLKKEDFFFVELHPVSRFESTSIVADGDGYNVTGMLTLRGQVKQVSFPAEIAQGDDGAWTLKSEFSMNRKVWGIEFAGKPDDLIKDDVLIKLDLAFPAS
jgi:polyisoprenoid-binding protein YceI